MTSSHPTRFTRALAAAAIATMLTVPTLAFGDSGAVPARSEASDAFERYAAAHLYGTGGPNAAAPDWLERHAAAQPYGV
jgi:fermentation-respiration switch protein FrsA (DUF1100 family)